MKEFKVTGQMVIEFEIEVSAKSAEEAERMFQETSITDVLNCGGKNSIVSDFWYLDEPEVSDVEELKA